MPRVGVDNKHPGGPILKRDSKREPRPLKGMVTSGTIGTPEIAGHSPESIPVQHIGGYLHQIHKGINLLDFPMPLCQLFKMPG